MARILVADDEPAMRELMSLACTLDGHEVVTAMDAPSTIAAYSAERPDVLLLDLSMPGGGGAFVLRHLRTANVPLVPVIVVSGFLADMKPEMDVFEVVAKPFSLDSLRASIRRALAPR